MKRLDTCVKMSSYQYTNNINRMSDQIYLTQNGLFPSLDKKFSLGNQKFIIRKAYIQQMEINKKKEREK